jgi:hypothetical protein
MQIPSNVLKRIKKVRPLAVNLHAPFIQDGNEYVTNSFFMVGEKSTRQNTSGQFPIMKIAIEKATPKEEESTRFDIQYLIDVLEILKKSGANFVDIKIGDLAMYIKGLSSTFDRHNEIDISALLMLVTK